MLSLKDCINLFWSGRYYSAMYLEVIQFCDLSKDRGFGSFAAWYISVWMCVFHGQQVWLFQVMYITATSPYLFMLALLIRNCLLPGARTGILFYLTPDWSRLNDLEVNFYIESCKLNTEEDFLSFIVLIRSCMWLLLRHICSWRRCLSGTLFFRAPWMGSSSI